MTLGELEEKLLIALYQESQEAIDLIPFPFLAEKYGFQFRNGYLAEAQKDMANRGMITGPKPIAGDETAVGQITGSGIRHIEDKYSSKDGVGIILEPLVPSNALLTEDGEPMLTEDGDFIELESGALAQSPVPATIDSADWTGIAQRLETDPAVVQAISNHIHEIDQLIEQSSLTNTERQKAKAITESLRLLVASPEPEWKAIAFLLTSPALTAVLNVAAIVQIVLKLFGIG